MTLQDIYLYLQASEISGLTSLFIIIAVIVTSLIEISPIKVNPWSWIAKKIGKALNGEVIEELQKVKKEVDIIKTTQEKSEKQR